MGYSCFASFGLSSMPSCVIIAGLSSIPHNSLILPSIVEVYLRAITGEIRRDKLLHPGIVLSVGGFEELADNGLPKPRNPPSPA